MYYIKKVLEDIVNYTYPYSTKLPRYRKFYVEVSDKTLSSKNGDYNESTHRIRIFNPDRPTEHIIKTTIHELAHHIDTINRGESDHGPKFYEEYGKLAKSAIDMGIFTPEDFMTEVRDSRDHNKFLKMIQGYEAQETDYKNGIFRVVVLNGYSIKDRLKDEGYQWNQSCKVWQKEIEYFEAEDEKDFLESISAEYHFEDARKMRIGASC